MVEVMTPWVSVKQAGGSSAKGLLEGLVSLLDAMVGAIEGAKGDLKGPWYVREAVLVEG